MTDAERDKLVKVLGLLGSANDGEVLQAARKAHQIVKSNDSSWNNIIIGSQSTKQSLVALDRKLRNMTDHDKKLFLDMRERYFAGKLNSADRTRLDYFAELYVYSDDEIPF